MAKNGGGSGKGGKVDLNSATREELMELEGVGERTVERLMEAREQMGRFESMEALAEIEGIGESTVRRLSEVLEVRGGSGGGGRSGSGGESGGGRSGSGGGRASQERGQESGGGAQGRGGSKSGGSQGRGGKGGGGEEQEEEEGGMMMEARELFLHGLSDIYDGERQTMEMLPLLAREVADDQVRTAFREHERETREQIQNLDRCFEMLGEQPQRMTCRPVEGLRQEHDEMVRERPSKQMMTMFALGAEAKTEGFEIASYRALVNMAGVMGEEECARLLQENLRQEERMAERVEKLSRDMGRQMQQAMR
jgi:competence ComEA-like helix-hairpin-helix protein